MINLIEETLCFDTLRDNIRNNLQLKQKGYSIFNKVRNKLFVWGKTFQYLQKSLHYHIKTIVINFNNLENFLQFIEDEGLSNFLEKLKKHILEEAKFNNIKNPKVYYIAYTEFQKRGIPHYHILIATNFYWERDDFGGNKYFTKNFHYGYLYIDNLQRININYLIKNSQKEFYFYVFYNELLKQKFNKQKVHFVLFSKSLIQDFPEQYYKLKTIHSFSLLSKLAIYATKITKLNKYTIKLYFKSGINLILDYKYQILNKVPIFKQVILYIQNSKFQTKPISIYSLSYLYKLFSIINQTIFNSNNHNLFNTLIQRLNSFLTKFTITYFSNYKLTNSSITSFYYYSYLANLFKKKTNISFSYSFYQKE